jgi:hypothetical protein
MTVLRYALIGLTVIAVIAVSAGIGLLVANGPECIRYLTAGH